MSSPLTRKVYFKILLNFKDDLEIKLSFGAETSLQITQAPVRVGYHSARLCWFYLTLHLQLLRHLGLISVLFLFAAGEISTLVRVAEIESTINPRLLTSMETVKNLALWFVLFSNIFVLSQLTSMSTVNVFFKINHYLSNVLLCYIFIDASADINIHIAQHTYTHILRLVTRLHTHFIYIITNTGILFISKN